MPAPAPAPADRPVPLPHYSLLLRPLHSVLGQLRPSRRQTCEYESSMKHGEPPRPRYARHFFFRSSTRSRKISSEIAPARFGRRGRSAGAGRWLGHPPTQPRNHTPCARRTGRRQARSTRSRRARTENRDTGNPSSARSCSSARGIRDACRRRTAGITCRRHPGRRRLYADLRTIAPSPGFSSSHELFSPGATYSENSSQSSGFR